MKPESAQFLAQADIMLERATIMLQARAAATLSCRRAQ